MSTHIVAVWPSDGKPMAPRYYPQTPETILRAQRDAQRDRDRLELLRIVDAYGCDVVQRWLTNIAASRGPSPGLITDPRRG